VDIITVNLGNKAHDVSALQQRLQMQRLGALAPDVIVTQEARSGWVTPTGYRSLPVIIPGAGQTRIIVRKSRTVLGHGYLRQHPGRAGAWPARSIPFAVIDRGDRLPDLWVVGMHLNSGIEAGGHFVATGERKVFTERYIEHAAAIGQWVERRMGGDAVVLGDTNVDAYADKRVREPEFPTRRFAAAGLREALPEQRSGTHGSRRIDRVFYTPGLRVSVRDLARRAPYDHQPVSVKVR
jgi:hypothetical protein